MPIFLLLARRAYFIMLIGGHIVIATTRWFRRHVILRIYIRKKGVLILIKSCLVRIVILQGKTMAIRRINPRVTPRVVLIIVRIIISVIVLQLS